VGHQPGNVGHHRGAEGLVAAFHQCYLETDLVEDQRQRATALAAAPAVGQGLPVLGFVEHLALNVAGNIARGNGCTAFFGFELVDLLVQRADQDAFLVVQRGPVDCTRQVVFGVFGFGTGIDDGVEFMQAGQYLGCG